MDIDTFEIILNDQIFLTEASRATKFLRKANSDGHYAGTSMTVLRQTIEFSGADQKPKNSKMRT